MKIIRTIPSLRKWCQEVRSQKGLMALVPTMGALHEGHLSLMTLARKKAGTKGKVVVTIFVNPTQFNQKSDLRKYPRQMGRDAMLCRKAGVDMIFAPSAETMYPQDFSTWVDEKDLSLPLCGVSRPGHFRGVCTVVAKLFNLIQPDLAVFGQKDAQQAAVIRRMVRDLNFPIQIMVAPIIREKNGLAMSSRNQRLPNPEKTLASKIYAALCKARLAFRNGEKRSTKLKNLVRRDLSQIQKIKIDYIEIVNPLSLRSTSKVSGKDLLLVAVFLGGVRLIDNLSL